MASPRGFAATHRISPLWRPRIVAMSRRGDPALWRCHAVATPQSARHSDMGEGPRPRQRQWEPCERDACGLIAGRTLSAHTDPHSKRGLFSVHVFKALVR